MLTYGTVLVEERIHYLRGIFTSNYIYACIAKLVYGINKKTEDRSEMIQNSVLNLAYINRDILILISVNVRHVYL